MRMRLRQLTLAVGVVVVGLALPSGAQSKKDVPAPAPDPRAMRFLERSISWFPDSVFRLVENTRYPTSAGAYRFVSVERTCESELLAGTTTALIDEDADTIWVGSIGELPSQGMGKDAESLKKFLSGFLPEAMQASMNLRVKVQWNTEPRKPGAILPLNLLVATGYGDSIREAGVTADGKYLVLGSEMSLKDDPVAVRRRLLAESDVVIWDTTAGQGSNVEIVEFSDFECPACKNKWPMIETVLEAQGDAIRHGMVSFPLTMIHPWAFRAANAAWCVARQNPRSLIPLKETFYSLQREMEVAEVTPTAVDFVAGQGLDEDAFLACYLQTPSIDAVHRQMNLGNTLGVHSTPTYVVNGWMIQLPDGSWFPDMVARMVAGEEP
jgi:protein-disulfide isomerase